MEKKKAKAIKRYTLTESPKLLDDCLEGYENALKTLHSYLAEKHKKETSEREYILNILYRLDTLVEPTTIHKLVCDTHGLVSLASIYNSLMLFQEIGVVRKIQILGDGMSYYERAYGNPDHPFAICPQCKTVWSLPPEDIVKQIDALTTTRFNPLSHTLIVTGICQRCLQQKKKEAIAAEKAYQEQLIANAKKRSKAKAKRQKAQKKTKK